MATAEINTLRKNDNKCDKCHQKIHPNFIGYHKCGYANCPICKDAITNSEYWSHIRSHPGHENDSRPLPRTAFGNRQRYGSRSSYDGGGSTSFNRASADATQLKVAKSMKYRNQ